MISLIVLGLEVEWSGVMWCGEGVEASNLRAKGCFTSVLSSYLLPLPLVVYLLPPPLRGVCYPPTRPRDPTLTGEVGCLLQKGLNQVSKGESR